MTNERLEPPRELWETAQYEDDHFDLGNVDERKLKIVAKGFLPRPEQLVFKRQKPTVRKVMMVLDEFAIEWYSSRQMRDTTNSYRKT